MLWVKSLHIVFMVSWYAGLFYLPRLFVYHALTTDARVPSPSSSVSSIPRSLPSCWPTSSQTSRPKF